VAVQVFCAKSLFPYHQLRGRCLIRIHDLSIIHLFVLVLVLVLFITRYLILTLLQLSRRSFQNCYTALFHCYRLSTALTCSRLFLPSLSFSEDTRRALGFPGVRSGSPVQQLICEYSFFSFSFLCIQRLTLRHTRLAECGIDFASAVSSRLVYASSIASFPLTAPY
jgi:hypothetical protein